MPRQEGFTLMELMIVLTIVGVVLGFGLPAFTAYRNTLSLRQARQQLVEDMRTARQYAVTRRAPVYVRFGTPPATTDITQYAIHIDSNSDGLYTPGERVYYRRMPRNTSLASVALAPTDTVVFDISGILWPGTSGGTLIYRNSKDQRDTLAVSAAGIAYRP